MPQAAGGPALHADSIDVSLLNRLPSPSVPVLGRVHSAFRRVVNVLMDDGRLISLCTDDLDDAPWSVRVRLGEWTAWHIAPRDRVTLSTARIAVLASAGEAVAVDLAGVRGWDAVSVPLPSDTNRLEEAATTVNAVIDELGVGGGALDSGDLDPVSTAIAARVRAGIDGIVAGELVADAAAVRSAAVSLIGLGPGLTPAGDDVLTGMLVVAAQPGSSIRLLPREVVAALAADPARTTLLSAVTVREAVKGRVRQSILDLLAGLWHGRLRGTEFGEVLAIGHTSGTDILTGIAAAIDLESRLRRRPEPHSTLA